MTSRLHNLTVDCADARALAWFWAQVLGWNVYYDDDPEVLIAPAFPPGPAQRPTMLFIPVPEGRTAKNRMHPDLEPVDRTPGTRRSSAWSRWGRGSSTTGESPTAPGGW